MLKTIRLLGVLMLVNAAVAAQDFEGIIYYEIAELKAAGMNEMAYMIKDGKARMEYGNGAQQSSVLFLPEENRMVVLIPQMRGFMSMDIDEMSEGNNEIDPDEAEQTGQTRSVAGKSCEVWRISDAEETYEVCVARNMGNFVMPNAEADTPGWARELMAEGFMPLEVVTLENGRRSVNMRAMRIEEKAIDDALFLIPEGYSDMTEMMKQMYDRDQRD